MMPKTPAAKWRSIIVGSALLVGHASADQHGASSNEKVGEQPAAGPQEVVTVFEERGVLTPKGRFSFEPSFEYIHSSASEVAIEGFTIIPALAIGLINVSELQRDTWVAAFTGRIGLTNRLEVEVKVPVIYRSEDVKERRILQGSALNLINDSTGFGVGDVEAAVHYQINSGGNGWPIFIANGRFKSDTGTGVFDVDRTTFRDDNGNRIGEVFDEQPTGSGFLALNPSLTIIYPSAPAVLYANLGYVFNLEEDVGQGFGDVDPGDEFKVGFGIGFAVNDRTSFSLGYDHTTVFETDVENPGIEPDFETLQIGKLLFGVSHRIPGVTTANLAVGIGVTDEAPDVQVTLRFPFRF